jgi:hypothetical protein
VQDQGETGLGGVRVECYSADNKLVSSAVTDSRGYYKICGLVLGDYTVKFNLPAGYTLSPALAGTDRALDSNPSISTSITSRVQVLGGSAIFDIDALAYQEAVTSIPSSGIVWPTLVVGLSGLLLILLGLVLI